MDTLGIFEQLLPGALLQELLPAKPSFYRYIGGLEPIPGACASACASPGMVIPARCYCRWRHLNRVAMLLCSGALGV